MSSYHQRIKHLSDEYRQALLRREYAATQQLVDYYEQVWASIEIRLNRLLLLIKQAQDAGQPLKTTWLWEQNRLRILQDQIAQEISQFASYGEQLVIVNETWAVHAGWQHAIDLMRMGFPPDANLSFNHVPSWALTHLVGNLQDGSPLKSLFDKLAPDGARRVGKVLFEGLAVGSDVQTIAARLKQQIGIEQGQALRIVRTETLRAYNQAAMANYQANSDIVQEWEWSAATDACDRCAPLNGKRFPLSTPFEAQHPNDRCCPIPITVSYESILAAAF
jgi:SPP1 gp7 family putative phage head morphogenesis protein